MAGRPVANARGVCYASVNLDYYGIGEDSALQSYPQLRSGNRWAECCKRSIGWATAVVERLSYALARTEVTFDAPPTTPGLPSYQSESRGAG